MTLFMVALEREDHNKDEGRGKPSRQSGAVRKAPRFGTGSAQRRRGQRSLGGKLQLTL
jgi:hypothetical protein